MKKIHPYLGGVLLFHSSLFAATQSGVITFSAVIDDQPCQSYYDQIEKSLTSSSQKSDRLGFYQRQEGCKNIAFSLTSTTHHYHNVQDKALAYRHLPLTHHIVYVEYK